MKNSRGEQACLLLLINTSLACLLAPANPHLSCMFGCYMSSRVDCTVFLESPDSNNTLPKQLGPRTLSTSMYRKKNSGIAAPLGRPWSSTRYVVLANTVTTHLLATNQNVKGLLLVQCYPGSVSYWITPGRVIACLAPWV